MVESLVQHIQQQEERIVTARFERGDPVLRPSPDLHDVRMVQRAQDVRLAGQFGRGQRKVVDATFRHERFLQMLASVPFGGGDGGGRGAFLLLLLLFPYTHGRDL